MNSASIIDLMKTPNGYSVLQNDTLINKPALAALTQSMAQQPTTIKFSKTQKISSMLPTKKFIPQQQNFTIYPYIYTKQQQNHRYVVIPSRTQWFNLNVVHQIERKQLPEWFKQRKGTITASMNHLKFEKNQELYRKYRNYIIDLGKTQYVSPTMARKGLAGDACAIIRIHSFLQKWGLINFIYKRPNQQIIEESSKNNDTKISKRDQSQFSYGTKMKDSFDKDKSLISKIYDKDDMQLLKKITRKFRPACNCCQSICGIVWYEYNQKLQRKLFSPVEQQSTTTIITSGEPIEYQIKVCYSCYYEKNFPVVLSYEDFVRKSFVENIKQIDFEKRYGKKKSVQFVKMADSLEKNKFSMTKCQEHLKIPQNQLLEMLLQIPVHNLQKISRIEPETDDQTDRLKAHQQVDNKDKEHSVMDKDKPLHETLVINDQQLKNFKLSLSRIDQQEKILYEEFLQAWLLKMYAKLQQLEQWDKSVQWRVQQNDSVKKHNIAEKIKKQWNKIEE